MMKDQKTVGQHFSIAFLSFFYVGFTPKAPGTFGSLATIPLILLLSYFQINIIYLLLVIVLGTAISCYLAQRIQVQMQLKDPQWIVMDEVLGMLTCWAFVAPSLTINETIAIFLLFRFFDIIKFWPASYFDRLHHGCGTILDDIVSGIYAGLALLGGKFFLSQIL